MKQKKTFLKLAECILEESIRCNLMYCTRMSDSISQDKNADLANKLTNIVLRLVSEDTEIFMYVLALLQIKKVKSKK